MSDVTSAKVAAPVSDNILDHTTVVDMTHDLKGNLDVDQIITDRGEEFAEELDKRLGDMDVIQFDSRVYYVEEGDNHLTVEVIRYGKCHNPCNVNYCTKDATAKKGVKYQEAKSVLNFKAHETRQFFKVFILKDDGEWNATLEFTVHLEAEKNADYHIPNAFKHASVRLIDADNFPTDRYSEEVTFDPNVVHYDIAKLKNRIQQGQAAFDCDTDIVVVDDQGRVADKTERGLGIFHIVVLHTPGEKAKMKKQKKGEEGVNIPAGEYEVQDKLKGTIGEVVVIKSANNGEGQSWEFHNPIGEKPVPPFILMKEFFSLIWSHKDLQNKSMKNAIVDFIKNLEYLLGIVIMRQIVDKVLLITPDDPGGDFETRWNWLIGLSVFLMLPTPLLHFMDMKKCWFGTGGGVRVYQQGNLMRKFLNYEDRVHASLDTAECVQTMARDADQAAMKGYMSAFKIASRMTKFFLNLVFFLIALSRTETEREKLFCLMCLGLMVFVAIVLSAWLYKRQPVLLGTGEKMLAAKDALIDLAQDTLDNYDLIVDYSMRPQAVARFETACKKVNTTTNTNKEAIVHTLYIPVWLTNLAITFIMITQGRVIIEITSDPTNLGEVNLGIFLATLSIMKNIGKDMKDILMYILIMQEACVSLYNVTLYMNLPTDVLARKDANSKRRETAKEQLKEARSSFFQMPIEKLKALPQELTPIDTINIKMINVTYNYPGDPRQYIFKSNFAIPPGKVVAVYGHHNSGKATLLKLLAEDVLPSKGEVFIMPHLKTVHVPNKACIFNETLKYNLFFGVEKERGERTIDEAKGLLQRLGLSEEYVSKIDQPHFKLGKEGCKISNADRMLICQARAFLAVPDVLILDRPTQFYGPRYTKNIMGCLRDFVSNRGLFKTSDGAATKESIKTVIYSTSKAEDVGFADLVLVLDDTGSPEGLKQVHDDGGLFSPQASPRAPVTGRLLEKPPGATMDDLHAAMQEMPMPDLTTPRIEEKLVVDPYAKKRDLNTEPQVTMT